MVVVAGDGELMAMMTACECDGVAIKRVRMNDSVDNDVAIKKVRARGGAAWKCSS